MKEIMEQLGKLGVIPVIRIERAESAVELGAALAGGGLPCAEITFRTEAAQEAISRLASAMPDLLVGAGTVLSVDQAERAVGAGAKFIVSPGFDPKVVDWCLERKVPVTPGVATPTEIIMGLDRGLTILKFFPAGVLGGPTALKAIGAAFPGVKYIPTGGVSTDNLADYLRLPLVHACGGSWIAPAKLIDAGLFDQITALAQEAVEIGRKVRNE
ncbi:MAG: bifunctional 4-hydroxy-2-oxoglutarate aldolase/2-dehydro-3-deoxy-phosphogluconate aldolase [Anaerolineales bacterium]|nr:bifunctional 4-hydroxy-2-oxoglutarate aldolase/2-dehydro-3-deoxy-phosphogluconate aldolase [Anaerolineales bacterium]